ncbi:MAG: hypothetical protein A2X36_08620 [Elusimicrobia bacterium GWA2_69_24]|nr:MAG: hypothetical protein A2X36_08620 [Elusimicrobia bacterium GWA2_69_24]HBL17604.1 hypothetical protein [Elusimicrobiota bacterium]
MKASRALLLAVLCAAPAPSGAGVTASGQVKNLYHTSRSSLDGAYYWNDLSRARVELGAVAPLTRERDAEGLATASVEARAEYDHEFRAGTFLRTRDYRLYGFGEPDDFLTMDQVISTGPYVHYRHRLYRGWVQVQAGDLKVRFGRQRVAWGTGKLWNPTDFLNPFTPYAVEREERRGVDALTVQKGLGALGGAEAAYVPAGRWTETDLLGRVRGNAAGTDLSLLGGKVASSTASWVLGGDFALDVREGNLHGEWSYTDLRTRTPFWKGMIGYEYSFSTDPPLRLLKDLWWTAEYFHNGRGHTRKQRYEPAVLQRGREIALGKDYLGLGLKKELHPLVNAEFTGLLNLDDRSHFAGPSVTWNAVRDFYLLAGWQRFGGTPGSEFGRLHNIAYFQAQYFF